MIGRVTVLMRVFWLETTTAPPLVTFRVALRRDNYHVFMSCHFVLWLDSDSSMKFDSRLVEIAFLLQFWN